MRHIWFVLETSGLSLLCMQGPDKHVAEAWEHTLPAHLLAWAQRLVYEPHAYSAAMPKTLSLPLHFTEHLVAFSNSAHQSVTRECWPAAKLPKEHDTPISSSKRASSERPFRAMLQNNCNSLLPLSYGHLPFQLKNCEQMDPRPRP